LVAAISIRQSTEDGRRQASRKSTHRSPLVAEEMTSLNDAPCIYGRR